MGVQLQSISIQPLSTQCCFLPLCQQPTALIPCDHIDTLPLFLLLLYCFSLIFNCYIGLLPLLSPSNDNDGLIQVLQVHPEEKEEDQKHELKTS